MQPTQPTQPTQSMHAHVPIGAPSAWVARFASLAPAGEVLDLACGSGRHARLFASLGHPVLAVDRDAAVLERLAALGDTGLTTLHIDLEPVAPIDANCKESAAAWPFAGVHFAAIVVTNYLYRPTLTALPGSLAPGGVLIYETFAHGNERFGKPSNPDFLLKPGELLHLAMQATPPLHIIAFEEGYVDFPAPAMMQRLCAVRLDAIGASTAWPRI